MNERKEYKYAVDSFLIHELLRLGFSNNNSIKIFFVHVKVYKSWEDDC